MLYFYLIQSRDKSYTVENKHLYNIWILNTSAYHNFRKHINTTAYHNFIQEMNIPADHSFIQKIKATADHSLIQQMEVPDPLYFIPMLPIFLFISFFLLRGRLCFRHKFFYVNSCYTAGLLSDYTNSNKLHWCFPCSYTCVLEIGKIL